MDLTTAYEAILAALGGPAHAAEVAELRRAFEARTGAFGPEDPWFEVRSRAFWDDALTTRRLGAAVRAELDEGARAWLEPLARAHRGLFVAERSATGGGWTVTDHLGGAAFVVDAPSGGLADALASADAAAFFDARVVARDEPDLEVALLPGVLFHPLDASPHVEKLVARAREADMAADEVLDALLRMERNLRSHARVKAGYAYRPEALTK